MGHVEPIPCPGEFGLIREIKSSEHVFYLWAGIGIPRFALAPEERHGIAESEPPVGSRELNQAPEGRH